MNLTNNTVLITGGTSGIGRELALQLVERGNVVLVTGRDPLKLEEVRTAIPAVHAYQSDISDSSAILSLCEKITADFPGLNMVINNAGVMRMLNLDGETEVCNISQEIDINLLGPIRMIEALLPHLRTKAAAAIVNVSSGLAFIPLASAPIYCATKAGVHSYTQSLRAQLQHTNVKVFELAPPPTSTPLLDNFGSASSNSSTRGTMKTDAMVRATLNAIAAETYEIRPGVSNVLRFMSRLAPDFMFRQLSKPVAEELANGRKQG